MKSVEFCYWLQGMFELAKPVAFTPEQTEMIRAHLAMVFTHEIDPSYPKDQQVALNHLHAQGKPGGPTPRC
ncbi:hypothetical protein [Thermomonas sp.]|jgi:nucleoside 2-deoxyribosyltransferase|uniref:hypothetical protein n=1 Tax=Thermomonas sp. TaxID=1971895 RepID=UPI00257AA8DA|nr:hypothetical protein [Thermomonas sp.]